MDRTASVVQYMHAVFAQLLETVSVVKQIIVYIITTVSIALFLNVLFVLRQIIVWHASKDIIWLVEFAFHALLKVVVNACR